MADFLTPNLCGASEQFNKLSSQFAGIKDSLQGSLEGEIDALKGELTASLSVLEADIKGLIPELPAIPDVSFISEIQNLVALPAGGLSSLTSLANIQLQFGDALSASGFSLDSIIGDATAAFSGGIDLCGGALPNFVVGPNGLPTLKPDDVGMPDGDPVDEDGADLVTPSAKIASVNASIDSDTSVAESASQETIKEIKTVVASESGTVDNNTKKKYDKADVVAKAKAEKAGVATSPQVAKVEAAVVAKDLPPPKPPIESLEVPEEVKVLQDKVASLVNSVNKSFEKLKNLLFKSKKEHPHNLISDGKRKVVKNGKKITIQSLRLRSFGNSKRVNDAFGGDPDGSIDKSMDLKETYRFFYQRRTMAVSDKNRLDSFARAAIKGEGTAKEFEDAINARLAPDAEKFITMSEQAFIEGEKVFTVESNE